MPRRPPSRGQPACTPCSFARNGSSRPRAEPTWEASKETNMQVELRQANIALDAHRVLSLTDAAGAEVAVVAGHVWLTTDGDLRDIFLAPGEAHSIERPGLTVINAVEAS